MRRSDQSRSLALFAVGVVVVVAALTVLGGWALPLVIALVIVIVMAHEFGHYLTAKRAGMKVTDFFVGFGPVLWSTTRGETRYGIRALLLGGYVKVPGMSWSEPIDPELEDRTYRSASYPRKVLFASAGSLMHLVMALVLAWAALVFIGAPNASAIGVASFEQWQGHSETAAQVAGLHVGDQFLSVDGVAIKNFETLIADVRSHPGRALTLVVLRDGRRVTLRAVPANGRTIKVVGDDASHTGGLLGVELDELTTHTGVLAAIPSSFSEVGTLLGEAGQALVHVFSFHEFNSLLHQVVTPSLAKKTTSQVTRPVSIVGVVRIADQAAQSNTLAFIKILITLNIFVGVMNMLPMLPLDGGYVAIATYERIRRGRRTEPYKADINKLAPVIYAFVGVLLILFACTLYLDIAYPIANPFN